MAELYLPSTLPPLFPGLSRRLELVVEDSNAASDERRVHLPVEPRLRLPELGRA